MGVDHRKFYKQFDNSGEYMILNTGSIPETEGIYESVIAADNVDANIFHTGPNLQLKNKSYKVASEWLTVPQMQNAYQTCKYTSGMRRIEGFEKTVIEGILCGSRPICFDTALYKYWYSNLAEYVKEGTARETAVDLQKIFSGPYRAVTDKEREIALQSFAWVNVAKNYWDSFNDITGGDNGK